jgi:uncharacterized membrane protein YphA (DoxX/SURF4 family)
MKRSKAEMAGWALSILVAIFLGVLSAYGKFFDFEGKEKMFATLGWDAKVMVYVGIVEVTLAILFLIPRTAFVAAILISAYLGGATAAHVRIHEMFVFPILIGVVAWVGLGLRDPRIFQLAFKTATPSSV